MLSTHQFLIILQHFTIIYALDVLGEQKLPPQNVFLMCELFKVKKLRNRRFRKCFFFSSVQSLSHIRLFVTPRTTAHQASLSITNSQSLLKLVSTESVMPSNHLILCRPLLLPPSIFPSIRAFSNESALRIRWPKNWSFSFSTNLPL